jgi:hypothetical protein
VYAAGLTEFVKIIGSAHLTAEYGFLLLHQNEYKKPLRKGHSTEHNGVKGRGFEPFLLLSSFSFFVFLHKAF